MNPEEYEKWRKKALAGEKVPCPGCEIRAFVIEDVKLILVESWEGTWGICPNCNNNCGLLEKRKWQKRNDTTTVSP